MTRPLVKICGVSREEEVDDLAALGVEFFGLVVDVPSPWTISTERAQALAAHGGNRIRPTLVTRPRRPAELVSLIEQTGVKAWQSAALNSPEQIREIRRAFARDELTILQVISYRRGQFWKEEQIDAYLEAGTDYILVDPMRTAERNQNPSPETIPPGELAAFCRRHTGKPILIAGGISAANVQAMMAAGGAVGIDVCSSVRRDGRIQRELVAELLERLSSESRPSLRRFLQAVGPGNHVVAYLTLGDSRSDFLTVAEEVLAAGAITLELGFPYAKPIEGAVLKASHERALAAGVTTEAAMRLLRSIAERHPENPLIAVVQWPAIEAEADQGPFLDWLVEAGAAAVLPVGQPTWQLPAFAERVHQRGLETVIPCAPNATRRRRELVYRYCSGALYVPRGRVTGGGQPFDNYAPFCRLVATETDAPIVVGVGVESAEDVSEICSTPAKAAAVGSALVEHLADSGLAGKFVKRLIGD